MAAFLLSIIRSSHCLLGVCVTVSELGFCFQATTGHSSPSTADFCFCPSEETNGCADTPALARLHAAACRSAALGRSAPREGSQDALVLPELPPLLLVVETEMLSLEWVSGLASASVLVLCPFFPFQGILRGWELGALRLCGHAPWSAFNSC